MASLPKKVVAWNGGVEFLVVAWNGGVECGRKERLLSSLLPNALAKFNTKSSEN